MAQQAKGPSRATSVLATMELQGKLPAMPVASEQDLGGTATERLLSTRSVPLDELPLLGDATHNLSLEDDPLTEIATCLTHPLYGTEPLQPSIPAQRGQRGDPRESITGLVVSLDIKNYVGTTGAPDSSQDQKWGLYDDNWVPGWLGMTLDTADAVSEGHISPFRSLLEDEQRDIIMGWQRDSSRLRYDNVPGEWVLKTVIGSNQPDNEDAEIQLLDWNLPDPTEGVITEWVDPLCFVPEDPQERKQNKELVGKLLGKGEDFETFVLTMGRLAFWKDYDTSQDKIPPYIRRYANLLEPLVKASDNGGQIESVEDFWRIIVPAGIIKTVSRTLQMLQELEGHHAEAAGAKPKVARESVKERRGELAERFVSAMSYYRLVHDLYRNGPAEHLERLYEKGIMNGPAFGQPMLLDVLQIDDMDRTSCNPTKLDAILAGRSKHQEIKHEHTDAGEILNRRLMNPNTNAYSLIIRAFRNQRMRLYANLSPTDRAHHEATYFAYNGNNGLDGGSLGAIYPDEIIRSLVEPLDQEGSPESQRVAAFGGLAMSGVIAITEVDTDNGPETTLWTSAKQQPHKINRALFGRYHAADRKLEDVHRTLVSGHTGLTAILAAEETQAYRVVNVKGQEPKKVTAVGPRLTNGDTFSVVTHDKPKESGGGKEVTRVIGNVRKQKPQTRRISSRPAKVPRKGTAKPQDVNFGVAPGNGTVETSIILANNRVYAIDGKGPEASGKVHLYKRTVMPGGKK